jgi:tetratricopeptide (TPR) repeat protein
MTGREDLFEESMRLGHSAAWDLQWERAIEFYRKALAEFPENPNALTSLGLALFETNRMEEALTVYQQAMAIAPDDPMPAEKCAEIYESKGDIRQAIEHRETAADLYVRQRNADKAIENWSHSARLDPHNLAVRSRLALTFERLGRKRDAAHEYLSVASILQENHKIERAVETAQMALRLQPTDAEARSALRALREGVPLPPPAPPRGRTGPLRMTEVEDILKQDTTPVPSEAEGEIEDPELAAQDQALTMLAAMLFEDASEGDEEESSKGDGKGGATGRLSQLRESFGGTKKYQTLGKALDLQTRGNSRQAAKEFKRAIDSGIDHPAAHYNLGLLLKELHDYDGARQHLMVAVGHPELALGANLALGRITRSKGSLADSAHFLLQALRLADNLSVGEGQSTQLNQLYDTILATQMEGDEEALSNIVENTLNILSGSDWLHRIKIAREQLDGHTDGPAVKPIYDLLSEVRTDRVVQALERIDHLLGQGYHFSAMEEALLALEYAPSYLGLHLRIAEILLQTGRREIGLDKLQSIAETHRVRGETIQATKIYNRMLKLSPININARERLIHLLTQQDRIDEALKEYIELANIYRQMAEITAARKTLAEALQIAQLNTIDTDWLVMILRELADIDIARLDWRRALLVYEQICKLDPSNDDAQIQVIDLNLRLGQEDGAAEALDFFLQQLVADDRGAEILPMLEEWTREYPGKQALHSRLAEAYRAVGRKADAIAQYDALGEIQLDAGQVREAIRTIKTILEMGPPDPEGYQELLKNLESGR